MDMCMYVHVKFNKMKLNEKKMEWTDRKNPTKLRENATELKFMVCS